MEDDFLTRWQIQGENRAAENEEERQMLGRFGRRDQQAASVASDPFAFTTRGHLLQFEAMAHAIRTDTAPPNSIETARHTIEIMTAMYDSGRTGSPVRIA